ncbi:CHASE2 domain-containing protein [Cupriavidus basilensis]
MGAIGALARPDNLRLGLALLMIGAVAVLASGTWAPGWYTQLNRLLADTHWLLLGRAEPSSRVVVVDIDETSLDAVGPWPWPRHFIAQLAEELFVRYGARAVALDIVFPEAQDADGDSALLRVARHHRLVFSQAFDFAAVPGMVHAGHLGGTLPVTDDGGLLPTATGYIGNFFKPDPGDCVGHITPRLDEDGVVRRIAPLIAYQGGRYPMLAMALLLCEKPGLPPALPWSAMAPLVAGTEQGFLPISWRHAGNGFAVASAADVLARQVPAQAIAGRYVLVGSSALGASDRITSPLDPWLPGVMVHAELLEGLLDEAAAPGRRFDMSWLGGIWSLASVLVLGYLFRRGNVAAACGTLALLASLWLALTVMLPAHGTGLAPALPCVVYLLFLGLQVPMEWGMARSETRRFDRRFRRYLPPAVLEALLRQRDFDAMRPVRRTLTVLFADIEGYTTLAEVMAPEQLVGLTEIVLGDLTAQVHRTEGTVDKYMGDAVMAFWNAPLEQPDHADRGLDCALAMLAGMTGMNERLRAAYPGLAPIRICVGIHSGEAVVGEIGSQTRKSYTAIGDTVNVAARLQDLCKSIASDLLVGQGTASLSRRHWLRVLGRVTLRGRSHSEVVYVMAGSSSAPGRVPFLDVAEQIVDS